MQLKYRITGIDCPNCALKLERKLQKIDGVSEASLNFMTGKLLLTAEDAKAAAAAEEVTRITAKLEPDAVLQPL